MRRPLPRPRDPEAAHARPLARHLGVHGAGVPGGGRAHPLRPPEGNPGPLPEEAFVLRGVHQHGQQGVQPPRLRG